MTPFLKPRELVFVCHLGRRSVFFFFFLNMVMSLGALAQIGVGAGNTPALLTPWTTIKGAWVAAPLNPFSTLPQGPKPTGFLSWQMPVAVAARDNYVYVADAGRRLIYRYDQMLQTLAPFTSYASGLESGIAVARDLSLYVIDRNARQVLRFSSEGRLLQKFGNEMALAFPVAVVLDDATGNIWVADGLYDHVVMFNSLGRVLHVFKPSAGKSISAMAKGPQGLYLLDPLGRQVVVMGLDGADRFTFGQDTLKMPGAVAVDRFNRVFVSDSFDNSIKIFELGKLVASVGTTGTIRASFNRITHLYIDQDTLYVADSLNARIQTFRITPAAPVPHEY